MTYQSVTRPVALESNPQISLDDLLKQAPPWAPATAPKLSSGFNAWMDTLPFGDNYHKKLAERKAKQEWIERERLNNPHFLLRRVEANNGYLQSRLEFLDKLIEERKSLPDSIAINIDHPGPPGDMGPKGPVGDQGPLGNEGPQGAKGVSGSPGLPGPQGPPGVQGEQGSIGDEGIQGPTGPSGPQGPAGLRGPTGPPGDAGEPGPRGVPWPTDGPQGPQGPAGDPGIMGEQGPQGPEGPAGGPSTAPLSISEIDALSGAMYKTGYVADGELLYSDNTEIKFESVPAEISGQPYIRTANEDKGLAGSTELVFHVNRPCFVYVLRDVRGTAAGGGQPPSWLANGFVKLDSEVQVSDSDMGTMAIYKSGMAMSGRISLGGNGAPPSVGYENNYVVVVAPSEEHATSGVGVIGLKIPAETEGNEAYEGSMGFSFTVNSPIFVMDLGVFNPLGNAPLPGTLSCRLYNMETGQLIAQQAFTDDNRGDAKGGALYKALRSPVQLPAGFKAVIAADGYGPEMKNGNSEGAAPSWSFDNDGGKITFGSDALYGEKGEMPSEVAGSPGNRFAAATFRYT